MEADARGALLRRDTCSIRRCANFDNSVDIIITDFARNFMHARELCGGNSVTFALLTMPI